MLIGTGKTSSVYRQQHQVIKQFLPTYPTSWIAHEAFLQKFVCEHTSLPVPECNYQEGNHFLTMDYIDGITLGDRMRKQKYKEGLQDLIALQKSTHTYIIPELSEAKSSYIQILEQSNLDPQLKRIAIDSIRQVEEMDNLCHLDFHFLNILWDQNQYYIIDWANAKRGNPVMDIARTYLLLRQYVQRMANKYLKLMSESGDYDMNAIQKVIPGMAALRLLEQDDPDFSEILIALIK